MAAATVARRARDAVRNDPYASRIVDLWTGNAAGAGITTVFDSLRLGSDFDNKSLNSDLWVLAEAIGTAAQGGHLRAEHRTHLRCEISASDVIQQAEDDEAVAPNSTGIGKMRWPESGRVISAFGSDKDGIDIAVPQGTPIKAAENGVVIYAGNGLKEFGNTVLVRHENGLVTVYGHASSLEVTRGQKVKRGQEIAQSGMSGNASSPQLHFEVRKNSAPVDPSTFLE